MNQRIVKTTPAKRLDDTAGNMRALVSAAKYDSNIRDLARRIIKDVPEKDYHGEVQAIKKWVKSNIRYTRDPQGLELLQTPRVTIQSGHGDCDDHSILIAALAAAVGRNSRFRVIGKNAGSHVYTEIETPLGWVDADTVRSGPISGDYKTFGVYGNEKITGGLSGMNKNEFKRQLKNMEGRFGGKPLAITVRKEKRPLHAKRWNVKSIAQVPVDPEKAGDYTVKQTSVPGEYLIVPKPANVAAMGWHNQSGAMHGFDDDDSSDIEIDESDFGGLFDSLSKGLSKVAKSGGKKLIKTAVGKIPGGKQAYGIAKGLTKSGSSDPTVTEDWVNDRKTIFKDMPDKAERQAFKASLPKPRASTMAQIRAEYASSGQTARQQQAAGMIGGGAMEAAGGPGTDTTVTAQEGGEKEPFYKTPIGMAAIGIGGYFALKAAKVI